MDYSHTGGESEAEAKAEGEGEGVFSSSHHVASASFPVTCLPVDFPERLQALHQQEMTAYKTQDYIDFSKLLIKKQQQQQCTSSTSNASSSPVLSVRVPIQEHWREVIGEWAYNLIDHFECPREVVSVCMNYIDRCTYNMMLQDNGTVLVTKQQFQLLAVTCLYLAIKMACPAMLTLDSMIYLSRDIFTAEQITATERQVLHTLKYQLHPPTSYVFLRHYMLYLQATLPLQSQLQLSNDNNDNNDNNSNDKLHLIRLLEAARFSLELSVLDYYFVLHRPSHVALAALLNALEEERIPSKSSQQIASQLFLLLLSSSASPFLCGGGNEQQAIIIKAVRLCQKRLRGIHSNLVDSDDDEEEQQQQQQGSATGMDDILYDEYGRMLSPISVATQRVEYE